MPATNPEDSVLLHALIHATTPTVRVHATDLDLVAILATDADTEQESAGREARHIVQRTRHQDRMTQRKQVDTGVGSQSRSEIASTFEAPKSPSKPMPPRKLT